MSTDQRWQVLLQLSMMGHTHDPRTEAGGSEFKTRLGHILRTCLKNYYTIQYICVILTWAHAIQC